MFPFLEEGEGVPFGRKGNDGFSSGRQGEDVPLFGGRGRCPFRKEGEGCSLYERKGTTYQSNPAGKGHIKRQGKGGLFTGGRGRWCLFSRRKGEVSLLEGRGMGSPFREERDWLLYR